MISYYYAVTPIVFDSRIGRSQVGVRVQENLTICVTSDTVGGAEDLGTFIDRQPTPGIVLN